jgi:hypothetical protein
LSWWRIPKQFGKFISKGGEVHEGQKDEGQSRTQWIAVGLPTPTREVRLHGRRTSKPLGRPIGFIHKVFAPQPKEEVIIMKVKTTVKAGQSEPGSTGG